MNSAETLTIAALGGRGDGIVETDSGRLFVPYGLAGETVDVIRDGDRARLTSIRRPSPDRIDPICRHFTVCGGCNMQHIKAAAYGRWKRGIVETALSHKGLAATVDKLIDGHGSGRRRITLHVRFDNGRVNVGFMAARSHRLLDLDACPILTPALANATAIAGDLARPLATAGGKLDVAITASDGGLDCHIRGRGGDIDLDSRLDLADVAQKHDLARIGVGGELILQRRRPVLKIGEAIVTMPSGGFIQATRAAERILARLVIEAIGPASRTADLFSGVGPFALRLAGGMAVHAIDNDRAALDALLAAARHTQGLKPVSIETRDLLRDPVIAADLARFDAVVFDPPRAGAQAQARQLAASTVPTVIAVSCDPVSFSRDGAILTDGGYRLEKVTPVDQFRYSPHVELVAVFRR